MSYNFNAKREEKNNPCPCRECTDRNANCHAICEAYTVYYNNCRKENDERQKAISLNLSSYTKWTDTRYKKARRGKK